IELAVEELIERRSNARQWMQPIRRGARRRLGRIGDRRYGSETARGDRAQAMLTDPSGTEKTQPRDNGRVSDSVHLPPGRSCHKVTNAFMNPSGRTRVASSASPSASSGKR